MAGWAVDDRGVDWLDPGRFVDIAMSRQTGHRS